MRQPASVGRNLDLGPLLAAPYHGFVCDQVSLLGERLDFADLCPAGNLRQAPAIANGKGVPQPVRKKTASRVAARRFFVKF